MTYERMMSIGKECGLTTIGECYDFVLNHYDAFFNIKNMHDEIFRLQKDICKKDPQGFMQAFAVSKELINEWNRK